MSDKFLSDEQRQRVNGHLTAAVAAFGGALDIMDEAAQGDGDEAAARRAQMAGLRSLLGTFAEAVKAEGPLDIGAVLDQLRGAAPDIMAQVGFALAGAQPYYPPPPANALLDALAALNFVELACGRGAFAVVRSPTF